MKYLKRFNESEQDIDSICQRYGITNYTINLDESIDVDGGVNLYDKKLTKLPLRFGKVTGDFNCRYNQLTSLTGAPTRVGGDFNCRYNQLTSLTGSPERVGGGFFCSHNQLTSLTGSPERVGGGFYCYHNPVQLIFDWFQGQEEKFLDKINFIYTDLWLDPVTIQLDVLEQIAEELEVQLPTDYQDQLLKGGYQVL